MIPNAEWYNKKLQHSIEARNIAKLPEFFEKRIKLYQEKLAKITGQGVLM